MKFDSCRDFLKTISSSGFIFLYIALQTGDYNKYSVHFCGSRLVIFLVTEKSLWKYPLLQLSFFNVIAGSPYRREVQDIFQ